MFFRIHAFQGPGSSEFMFFRVQFFQGVDPESRVPVQVLEVSQKSRQKKL